MFKYVITVLQIRKVFKHFIYSLVINQEKNSRIYLNSLGVIFLIDENKQQILSSKNVEKKNK